MILLLLGSGIVVGIVAAGAMLWAGLGILTAFTAYVVGGMIGMMAGAVLAFNRTDPGTSALST